MKGIDSDTPFFFGKFILNVYETDMLLNIFYMVISSTIYIGVTFSFTTTKYFFVTNIYL